METEARAKRQAPLKVDPETDELISQGAHFLGMTKKDLVAEAVRAYLAERREQIHNAMTDAMQVLDGTTKSRVGLIATVSSQDIDRLGGIR